MSGLYNVGYLTTCRICQFSSSYWKCMRSELAGRNEKRNPSQLVSCGSITEESRYYYFQFIFIFVQNVYNIQKEASETTQSIYTLGHCQVRNPCPILRLPLYLISTVNIFSFAKMEGSTLNLENALKILGPDSHWKREHKQKTALVSGCLAHCAPIAINIR